MTKHPPFAQGHGAPGATDPAVTSSPAAGSVLPFARLVDLQKNPEPGLPVITPPAYGRLPWRVVRSDDGMAGVLDADDHTLFIASLGIARQIEAAVNGYLKSIASTAVLARALRDIERRLRQTERTAAVAEALRIIDAAFEMERR